MQVIFDTRNHTNDYYDVEVGTAFSDELLQILKSTCIVMDGIVSTWGGQYKGGMLIEDKNDLNHVLYSNNSDYTLAYFDNGVLHVDMVHHDGVNSFILRKLTNRGMKYLSNHVNLGKHSSVLCSKLIKNPYSVNIKSL